MVSLVKVFTEVLVLGDPGGCRDSLVSQNFPGRGIGLCSTYSLTTVCMVRKRVEEDNPQGPEKDGSTQREVLPPTLGRTYVERRM